MPTTYAGSRLEATGTVTGSAKRHVRRVLEKQVRTAPGEKLMMEVEISVPSDVTDIQGDKQRVAEVVAKLISKLKEDPLKEGKTDQEWLDGAIKFLVTEEGKLWIRRWFQPQTTASGSASSSPTVIASKISTVTAGNASTVTAGKASHVAVGKAKMMSNVHGNAQLEHQAGPSHGTGVQFHDASASIAPLLSSHMGDKSATGPTPRSIIPEGTASGIGPSHRPTSVPGLSLVQTASPMATKSSSSAKEVASAPSQLLPSAIQHQRSHSDPGQLSLCLKCHTIHGMSYGGPFPTVPSSSEAASTTRGMQVQRNVRNESWAVYIMRHGMTPLNMIAWSLFIMFLVQLSQGYPRN